MRNANNPTTHVIATLNDLKARDVRALDVGEQSSFTDFMIISTGTSSRHVSAIVDAIVLDAKRRGARVLGIEGRKSSEWVLIDLDDVVVHVMQRTAREFYDLERLWGLDPTHQQAV